MREIVLDTETTGLDPAAGHRIVELGCLELLHHLPTGRSFREYINPERDIPEEAARIHGLTTAFLADKPRFAEVVQSFLDFIGDAPLPLHPDRAVDTVALARRRFPGAQVNLDALCRRFEIDNAARSFHGALLDCELLAEVYLELRGGRQPGFDLASERRAAAAGARTDRALRVPRAHEPTAGELYVHEAMLDDLEDPIWRR
jgi:DNA polymerase-3 subunit epsilon